MDKHPTGEQIKKFWEWCELHYEDYGSPQFPHMGGQWQDRKGNLACEEYTPPPIDLNNLFKYAVPKLDLLTMDFQAQHWMVWVKLSGKTLSHISNDDDPALALFWAIWEAIPHSPDIRKGATE